MSNFAALRQLSSVVAFGQTKIFNSHSSVGIDSKPPTIGSAFRAAQSGASGLDIGSSYSFDTVASVVGRVFHKHSSTPVHESLTAVIEPSQEKNAHIEQLVGYFIKVAAAEGSKFGENTRTDDLLSEMEAELEKDFPEFLSALVSEAFDKPNVLVATLKAMGNIEFDARYYSTFAFAMAAYPNVNARVKEAVIHLIEKWSHPLGLKFLKNCDPPPLWLEQYRQKVIAELQAVYGTV
jgi:hypothetical protein